MASGSQLQVAKLAQPGPEPSGRNLLAGTSVQEPPGRNLHAGTSGLEPLSQNLWAGTSVPEPPCRNLHAGTRAGTSGRGPKKI